MKSKKEKLLNYIYLWGENLLELMNQKFFIIFYSCFTFNLFVIFILFLKNFWLLSFIFLFTSMILLKMNKLIKVGELQIYDIAYKKILFFNLILILLNLLNIFFNVFRYVFYDFVKFIREYFRIFLFNFFDLKLNDKFDIYFDNIVAYISWDVVWVTICLIVYMYIDYVSYLYFDWKKEDLLVNDILLQKKLFWCFKNEFLRYLSIFFSIYIRVFIFIALFSKYFNVYLLFFLIFIFFLSLGGAIIFWLQFTFSWYKFIYINER